MKVKFKLRIYLSGSIERDIEQGVKTPHTPTLIYHVEIHNMHFKLESQKERDKNL